MSYELVPFQHAVAGAKPHFFAVMDSSDKPARCILPFNMIIQAFRDCTRAEQRAELAVALLEGTDYFVGHAGK